MKKTVEDLDRNFTAARREGEAKKEEEGLASKKATLESIDVGGKKVLNKTHFNFDRALEKFYMKADPQMEDFGRLKLKIGAIEEEVQRAKGVVAKTKKMLEDSKQDIYYVKDLPAKFGERKAGLLAYVKQMGKAIKQRLEELDAELNAAMKEEEKGRGERPARPTGAAC